MDEMMILAMLLCVGLAGIGLKMRMWPVTFVSSMGWCIISIQLFSESQDYLVLALMLMVAISQVILVKDKEDRRW